MGLILIQPDLGTASVYLPIFIVMCFIAGIPSKYLLFLISFGVCTVVFAVLPVWNSEIAEKPLVIISILTNFKLRTILIFATFIIALIGIIIRRYFHGPDYIKWITYVFFIISLSLIFSLILAKVLKDWFEDPGDLSSSEIALLISTLIYGGMRSLMELDNKKIVSKN
jgi:rod shape determining protein RodA